MNQYVRASAVGLALCRTCFLTIDVTPQGGEHSCPRCGSLIQGEPVASLDSTWAWWIAGMILYIPANLLPVMRTSGVIGAQDSTIAGGIVQFWHSGAWGIAGIIFVASMVVPLAKFAVIGLLLFTSSNRSALASSQRAALYRAVEVVGYWSMLDVIVVAITSALVQFKALGSAEPRPGIAFFCTVVIATMLAARSFDPRLIWLSSDRSQTT